MSHSPVTVVVPAKVGPISIGSSRRAIDDYLSQVLAPYDENERVDPYRQAMDGRDLERMAEHYKLDPAALDALAAKMHEWSGNPAVVEDGTLYEIRTYNPKSKWDWWTIGGRWSGYFKAKPDTEYATGSPGVFDNAPTPGFADIIRQGDVDWEGMAHDAMEKAREWYRECVAKGRPPVLFGPAPADEDEFARSAASPATHAVIDADGEWAESGTMGWFGVEIDPKDPKEWADEYVRYIGSLDRDDILVVVDCHI